MQLSLVLAASLLALALLAALAALRVEFNARGRGEADGAWVVAGALAVGPLSFSGVAARGTPLRVELHWGRWRWPLLRPGARPKPKPTEAEAATKPSANRWGSALGLGPLELAELALREGRYLSWERLLLDVTYGFNDVALTGRVAGALYALSGALPAKFVIRQQPIWAASERWDASIDGSLRLWPGLVLLSVLWYMLRRKVAGIGAPRRQSSGLTASAHNPS